MVPDARTVPSGRLVMPSPLVPEPFDASRIWNVPLIVPAVVGFRVTTIVVVSVAPWARLVIDCPLVVNDPAPVLVMVPKAAFRPSRNGPAALDTEIACWTDPEFTRTLPKLRLPSVALARFQTVPLTLTVWEVSVRLLRP